MAARKRITVYIVAPTNGRKFYSFQWLDDTSNKRKTQSSKCTTKRAAERAAVEFEAKLNSLHGDGSILFADLVTLYTEDHLASLRDKTKRKVISTLNVFQKKIDPERARDITSSALTDYARKLRKDELAEPTIFSHLDIISRLFRWAIKNGHVTESPKIPQIAHGSRKHAKGRPLADDEFAKILSATRKVVGDARASSWARYLVGLWLSGLRLEESIELVWGDGQRHESTLWIDTTSGKRPLMGIVAESEKGRQDRLMPITGDFGRWLLRVPKSDRKGFVFPLDKWRRKEQRNADYIGKTVSMIGEAAGVVVNKSGKFASAHDLRRTFGLRWAQKVMPAELQQLMRHADISTTMDYYALVEATTLGDKLWDL